MEQIVGVAEQAPAKFKESTTARWLILAGLAAIVMIGAAVRFYQLGAESYWYDELIMARLADMNWRSLLPLLAETGRPPLYVLLAKAWTDVFGATETAGRSLSAVLSILSIPMMYATGKALFDREIGLLSAFVCALAGFQVYYAQEFRYYSLVMLLSLIALYSFARAMKTQRIGFLLLFGLSGILLFYTHVLAVVVLVAPGMYFLLHWRQHQSLRVPWLLVHVAIGLALLPWLLPELKDQIQILTGASTGQFGAGTWIPVPSVYAPVRTVINFMVLGRRYLLIPAAAAGGAVLLLGMATHAISRGTDLWLADVRALVRGIPAYVRDQDGPLMLIALWLVVPIALIFVGSLVISPFYVDRYLITASPGVYLLAAVIISYFRRVVPQPLVALALICLLGGVLYNYYREDVKDQWREAAAYLSDRREPGDALAFSAERSPRELARTVRDNFYWYYQGNRSDCLVEVTGDADVTAGQLAECDSGDGLIWMVMWDDVPEPVGLDEEFANGDVKGVSLLDTEKFYGVTVFLFDVRD